MSASIRTLSVRRLLMALVAMAGLVGLVGAPASAGTPGIITTEVTGLNAPHSLVYDPTENSVFISDTNSCQVLQDNLTTSTVSVLVNTAAVCGGPSAPGTAASGTLLDHPHGLALDKALGLLYIADRDNHGVDVVNLTASPPVLQSFVGLLPGAPVSAPVGLSVDQGTHALYIADQGVDVVWKLPFGGSPSVYAGVESTPGFNGNGISATSAYLNQPSGVDFVSPVLYIADTDNNEVRSVSGGVIQDVVGSPLATSKCSPDGSPPNAPITNPTAVRLDGAGTLFYDETGCNVVREVGPSVSLLTVAGTVPPGVGTAYPYSGLAATSVALNSPHGLTFVPDTATSDDLWFSDTGNNVVDSVSDAAAAGMGSSPGIDSANTATGAVGTPLSFLVTTSGSPTPTLKEKGKLPKGLTFVDNHNGTATVSGTPASTKHKSAAVLYHLTVSATFGKGHAKVVATQVLALLITP